MTQEFLILFMQNALPEKIVNDQQNMKIIFFCADLPVHWCTIRYVSFCAQPLGFGHTYQAIPHAHVIAITCKVFTTDFV